MKQRSAVVVVWLVLIVGAWCPALGNTLPGAAELRQAEYVKHWEASLPLQPGDRVADVYVLDDNLYATTDRGEVLAVDRRTGLVRWARSVTDESLKVLLPTHIDDGQGTGAAVFTTATKISIVDRYSGELLKEIPPSFAFGSPAVADSGRAFVGSSDGHFYAVRWHDPVYRRITRLWRVSAGGPVVAAPVLRDVEHLYFASQGGGVFCCTSDDKDLNWQFKAKGAIVSDMHVDDTGVYFSCTDRSVYRLDAAEGKLRWRRQLPEILRHAPVVVGGAVYQYCPGFGLYAIDAEYGDVLWKFADGKQFVVRTGDRLGFATGAGNVAWVDRQTGSRLQEIPLRGGVAAAVNRDDDALYVWAPDGSLLCAEPEGERPLSRGELEAAYARVNQPPATRDESIASSAEPAD